MSFFTVTNLTAGYDKSHIIEDISFEIERGCLMGVLGANGSGKTTMLKSICGILPHEGSCVLEECRLERLSVRQLSQCCSYIPQRSGIGIDIPVLDVVLMGFNPRLGILEHPTKAMEKAALQALAQVGLTGKELQNYMHLSEGQKQLCILARTLVSDSKLLLLDEPESALDFRYRYKALNLLNDWVKEQQRAAIVTLHDPSLALNYCDTLLLLDEGKVLGILHPKTDSLDAMEQLLTKVYGAVSLQLCTARSGKPQLVMLKEDA